MRRTRSGPRVRREHRHEQSTTRDLPADLRIPRIAANELVLVKPHLDSRRPQRLGDTPHRLRVLRRVAQKYSVRFRAHGGQINVSLGKYVR